MIRTLTTERLKALLDELKSWQYGYDPVDDKEQFDMLATAEWAVIELLANREAQPFGYVYTSKDGVAVNFGHELPFMPEKWNVTPVYTAPPAPAVPGIDELRLTFERSERESDDGFNLHKYGIGYADGATQARWESWLSCRAAMLAAASEGGNDHDTRR